MANQFQLSRKGNIWASLRQLLEANALDNTVTSAPTSGTTGTLAGQAGPGAEVTDTSTGNVYRNVGTKASPIWLNVGSPVIANSGLGILGNAKMTYDFAVDGGAVSTITPTNSPTIPNKAIILGGTIDITTTLTSGGSATIALGLGSGGQAAALKAALAVASWGAGQLAIIPVFTAATYYKATAAAKLSLTIATAALTAGKFDVNVAYVVGN
jgi:hypothetical protein